MINCMSAAISDLIAVATHAGGASQPRGGVSPLPTRTAARAAPPPTPPAVCQNPPQQPPLCHPGVPAPSPGCQAELGAARSSLSAVHGRRFCPSFCVPHPPPPTPHPPAPHPCSCCQRPEPKGGGARRTKSARRAPRSAARPRQPPRRQNPAPAGAELHGDASGGAKPLPYSPHQPLRIIPPPPSIKPRTLPSAPSPLCLRRAYTNSRATQLGLEATEGGRYGPPQGTTAAGDSQTPPSARGQPPRSAG